MKQTTVFKYICGPALLAVILLLPFSLFAQSGGRFGVTGYLAAHPELFNNAAVTAAEDPVAHADSLGDVPKAAAAAGAGTDYYPLVPGSAWTYTKNVTETETLAVLKNNTRTVEGVKTAIIQHSGDKFEEYYTNDADGLRMHGQYSPRDLVNGHYRAVRTTMTPPIKMLDATPTVGQKYSSSGIITGQIAGLGKATMSYSADYTVTATETVTVTAGTFEAIHLTYTFTIEASPVQVDTGHIYLARGVGEIKESYVNSDESAVYELTATNSGVHDLAVTSISAPATVNLSTAKPSKTAPVKVAIQNRGLYAETIQDLAMLTNLVTVTAHSLGSCADPVPVISPSQKKFPITLKSKASLVINYNVTFSCANDPAKSTSQASHADYRFSAAVNTAALGEGADGHTTDDTCPRSVTAPYVIDPYPDHTIKDKGCGARKTDGTYGGDILTDVVMGK